MNKTGIKIDKNSGGKIIKFISKKRINGNEFVEMKKRGFCEILESFKIAPILSGNIYDSVVKTVDFNIVFEIRKINSEWNDLLDNWNKFGIKKDECNKRCCL